MPQIPQPVGNCVSVSRAPSFNGAVSMHHGKPTAAISVPGRWKQSWRGEGAQRIKATVKRRTCHTQPTRRPAYCVGGVRIESGLTARPSMDGLFISSHNLLHI